MSQTQQLLDQFCSMYPNSGHHLDEERFKSFVISSFREKVIFSEESLVGILKAYKNQNGSSAFSEEQAIERASEYQNYIDLLNLYTRGTTNA